MTVTLVIQLPSLRCNPGCLTSLYMDTVHWSRLKSGNCHSYQQPSKCKVKIREKKTPAWKDIKGSVAAWSLCPWYVLCVAAWLFLHSKMNRLCPQ